MLIKRALSALLLLLLVELEEVAGYSNFVAYETSSNSIDDGNKIITQLESSKLNPAESPVLQKRSRVIIAPSTSRGLDGIDRRRIKKQLYSNEIGPGFEGSSRRTIDNFYNSIGLGNVGFRRGGFVSSARAVESPSQYVDSGGHSTSSLAKEIAKLLNVKQGFYSDIYDRIDPSNSIPSTRKPAAVIDETIRNSVQHLFSDNPRNRHVTSNHLQQRSLNII